MLPLMFGFLKVELNKFVLQSPYIILQRFVFQEVLNYQVNSTVKTQSMMNWSDEEQLYFLLYLENRPDFNNLITTPLVCNTEPIGIRTNKQKYHIRP